MKKQDLVRAVAAENGITQRQAEEIIKSTFQTIKKCMVSGDKVIIPTFGTFTSVVRAAKIGRNPKTGKEVKIPERRRPIFRANAALKYKFDK